MSKASPKKCPNQQVIFMAGDIVRRKGRESTYKVLGVNDAVAEALCRSEISNTEGWLSYLDIEKVETLAAATNQIDKTLTERGSRYGSFNDLAQISQALKEVMRTTPGWAKLTASQKEALEMVQHKVARMLNGDPTYQDNAVDIVGYATLMMKNMQGDLSI